MKIYLDWTANTNHTGIYVALQKGYYKDAGLDVEIITPDTDNYEKTPALHVCESDELSFAIAPSESVISYKLSGYQPDLVAVATILQKDVSALCSTTINSLTEIDSTKTYASYNARFEDGIVKTVIKQAGAKDYPQIVQPEKLDITSQVVEGKFDLTWIFTPWEGLANEMGETSENKKLKIFPIPQSIPYGYSPLILCKKSLLHEQMDEIKSFVEQTRRGYMDCIDNPEDTCKILQPYVSTKDSKTYGELSFLIESQKQINSVLLTEDTQEWGKMTSERWTKFIIFLIDEKLLMESDYDRYIEHVDELFVPNL